MARGDYAEVTYRTGAGTERKRVVAKTVGATVDFEIPRTDPFITVRVVGQNGIALETHMFAKGEVVAFSTGHDQLATASPRRKK